MKITIDASRVVNEKGGVCVYLTNLIHTLLEIDSINNYTLLFFYAKDHLQYKQKIIKSINYQNMKKKVFRFPGKLKNFLIDSKIPFPDFFESKTDLFFASTVLEAPLKSVSPFITCVYDLTYYLFPEHLGSKISLQLQERTRIACLNAKKIITISESTKNDLIQLLNVDSNKIAVTPLAAENCYQILQNPNQSILKKYRLPQNFFLAVGTISPRKNYSFLFEVFELLPKRIQDHFALVIVGEKGWNYEEIFRKGARLLERSKMIFLDYVSKEELVHLYNLATLFLFPSLYEGFGIPILEAMSCGLPIISSNTSSMPEVVGTNGVCLSPFQHEAWVEAIIEIVEDSEKSTLLSKQSVNRSKQFSWSTTALQTLKIVNSVYD